MALELNSRAISGIARNKEVLVADNMVTIGNQIQWNMNFSKAVQDQKIDTFENFLTLLYFEIEKSRF